MLTDVSGDFVQIMYALGKLVILAMLLERGLYFIFDYSKWRDWLEGKGVRAPVAFLMALFVCWWYDFDILAVLLDPEAVTPFGIIITATIVAGGSSAAIVLFQDVLRFGRAAQTDMREMRKLELEAKVKSLTRTKRKVAEKTDK